MDQKIIIEKKNPEPPTSNSVETTSERTTAVVRLSQEDDEKYLHAMEGILRKLLVLKTKVAGATNTKQEFKVSIEKLSNLEGNQTRQNVR